MESEAEVRGPEPLLVAVTVRCSPEKAFEVFTTRIGSWWPFHRYSIYQENATGCVLEGWVGGKVYETAKSGERGLWGEILAWEPPRRFVMAWHPGRDPSAPTEVELRFSAVPEGTRVELTHRNWGRLGADAEAARARYEGGWPHVLGRCFADACG
jgi:uncharacterized protein YndB with AHSA1/START domain